MGRFEIQEEIDFEQNPFDRQERISGWDQEKLSNARVMVIGAGATGNETLKNLALLGIGNIFIADFDHISTSNLSRTVLFRESDKGKRKARVAAETVADLNLNPNARVDWFDGDIVWELGAAMYREMDVVLGCLDNVETRFAVNRLCRLTQTSWIDSGIYELAGHVAVFMAGQLPCYQCGASNKQVKAARHRYSCDNFKRAMLDEGKMPTVQITSAFISALQVQEAVKLICGQHVEHGVKLFYQGTMNDFEKIPLLENPDCLAHSVYPEIIPTSASTDMTLKEFLNFISGETFSGQNAVLDTEDLNLSFVTFSSCRTCGKPIKFMRPHFRIFDVETICEDCRKKGLDPGKADMNHTVKKEMHSRFSLSGTDPEILDMKLFDLGIPRMPVVSVMNTDGQYKYYELSDDKHFFPGLNK